MFYSQIISVCMVFYMRNSECMVDTIPAVVGSLKINSYIKTIRMFSMLSDKIKCSSSIVNKEYTLFLSQIW